MEEDRNKIIEQLMEEELWRLKKDNPKIQTSFNWASTRLNKKVKERRRRIERKGIIMLLNPEDYEHLDYVCNQMFGHTDWELVEDFNDKHIIIKFNIEDTREEE
jgi:hypothetical protein|tara:strand:- start:1697 stop:2008 length:312 start_codon:yes stop_codon:yes gene_type:complete